MMGKILIPNRPGFGFLDISVDPKTGVIVLVQGPDRILWPTSDASALHGALGAIQEALEKSEVA